MNLKEALISVAPAEEMIDDRASPPPRRALTAVKPSAFAEAFSSWVR
jgi:hypothetical protein